MGLTMMRVQPDWRPWLRRAAWLLIAAVAVSMVVAAIAAWEGGPALGSAVSFERFAILIAINFAVFVFCAIVASAIEAMTRKWHWVEQFLLGTTVAFIAILTSNFWWPGWRTPWLMDAYGFSGSSRSLAAIAIGGSWALIHHFWRGRQP